MSALQLIDATLFRFVNETLRNPVFDSPIPVFIIGGRRNCVPHQVQVFACRDLQR